MTKEYVLEDTGKLGILNFKPNYSIYFHRGNEKVGMLDFNGPEMTFSGDMDESAKLFLEVVENAFKARLEQERAKERDACIKIVENEAMQYAEPVWAFEIVNDIKARGQA